MLRLPLATVFLSAALICFSSALPDQSQLSLNSGSLDQLADSWSYVDCGEPEDAVQILSISVSPDPPKIGAELTVTIDAVVQEVIEEGATAEVLVKVGRIKLLQKTFDICEEARNANASVSCPVEPGPYTIVQSVELPKEVPKLKYVVTVRGFTEDDRNMVCIDLTMQWRPFLQFWD
ncbi:ML domain-containing protein [Mycena rebaudengoi]|nr:ML domain-containing protein [Mycena rebaudengoi]